MKNISMGYTNQYRCWPLWTATVVLLISLPLAVTYTSSSDVLSTNPYLVMFPNSLMPGIPLDVRVTILNASQTVQVTASLQEISKAGSMASATAAIAPGHTVHLQLTIPMDLHPSTTYAVVVDGQGGLDFRTGSVIKYEKKALTIFTQTDKSRYSGGQQVKFRSVLLLPNLLGYTGNATVTIYDGKNNKIQAIGPQRARDGVISGMITLGKEAQFGDWMLVTTAQGTSHEKKITVKPYELPKFGVNIVLVAKNDTDTTVKVTAKYTFNSDVHGNCTIEVFDPSSNFNKRSYKMDIKGSVTFTVKTSDVTQTFGLNHGALSIRALVTDSASAITMVGEKGGFIASTLHTYHQSSSDDVHIRQFDNRKTFVPGMPFYTTLAVMKDNELVPNVTKLLIEAVVTSSEIRSCMLSSPPYPWREEIRTKLPQFYVDSDPTGLVPLTIDVPHNAESIFLTIRSELSFSDSIWLYPLTYKDTPMLRIIPFKPHSQVGGNINLNVTCSEDITGILMVEAYARGIAVHTQTVSVTSTRYAHVSFAVTSDMVPYTHVVVTHVTERNAFMYDYALIKVFGSAVKNQVNVTFNTTTLEPGQNVEMTLTADPNSTVYVLTEDLKNRLLGTDNDIYLYELAPVTTSTGYNASSSGSSRDISRKRSARQPRSTPKPIDFYSATRGNFYSSGYSFMDDGIIVLPENSNILSRVTYSQILSSHNQYPRECVSWRLTTTLPPYTHGPYPGVPGMTYAPGMFPTYVPGFIPTPAPGFTYAPGMFPNPSGSAAPVVRSYFPETWIWEEFQIGQSGIFKLPLTVPDSITSWVTSVFATNEKTGFGVAESKPKITVKKDFFVTMDPPKQIVFGEEFLLQMTVFNYLDTAQKVLVQVNTSDDPKQMMESTFTVNPGDGHSTFFQITPQHIGVMKITAIAHAGFFRNTAVDEVEREVNVKPSGVHVRRNEQHLVEVSLPSNLFNHTFAMPDPPNMVPGSKTAKVSITGDFMTNTIEGLEKLINMPFGCGEQTMLNFAPDIYVTKYLQAVGKLTDKVRNKAMTFMESGLQRELTYKHTDGSFSAFGNQDSSGSSWLTAFVLKCFQQADGLLEIDEAVKFNGLDWLLRYQKPDGSFYEPGRIIHTQMQAGTGSGIKLTAFILNSVLENANHSPNSRAATAISKASMYLEKNLHNVTDMYTLAIVCYALAQSNSPSKTTCFNKLESAAVHNGDKMYWLAKTKIANLNPVSGRATATRAPSADIEATSYCLLTYLTMGQRLKAKPIIKWLISQRNPSGGFQSTQDTIISLQALALYASQGQQGSHVDFRVRGGAFSHDYSVTLATSDLMHAVEVPASLPELHIEATGAGNAVVDVTMSYYVSGIEDNHLIAIKTIIVSESLNAITVSPCVRWNGDEASGMIVAEVEMPTGFDVDGDKLGSFPSIKKHETIGQSVALYFDGMGAKQETCVLVTFVRTDPVVKSQACHVTVYDYYEPTNQARTRYESGVLKSTTVCDVCPECSFCKPGGGIGQIGVGK